MLGTHKLVAFVGMRDPERARAFYRDTLRLRLVSEDRFAIVFDAHGTTLRVNRVAEVVPARYTVLGWHVPDIVAAATELGGAGITFERFAGLEQDALGIWTAPDGARVAWFKDPDGNLLSIAQV